MIVLIWVFVNGHDDEANPRLPMPIPCSAAGFAAAHNDLSWYHGSSAGVPRRNLHAVYMSLLLKSPPRVKRSIAGGQPGWKCEPLTLYFGVQCRRREQFFEHAHRQPTREGTSARRHIQRRGNFDLAPAADRDPGLGHYVPRTRQRCMGSALCISDWPHRRWTVTNTQIQTIILGPVLLAAHPVTIQNNTFANNQTALSIRCWGCIPISDGFQLLSRFRATCVLPVPAPPFESSLTHRDVFSNLVLRNNRHQRCAAGRHFQRSD